MSVCSYIWESQAHLSTCAFWLEITAAVIEVVVGIVIVVTFHKEWGEHIKRRLEFLFEVGFLIAALIAIIAIVSNRRIESLREEGDKEAVVKTNIAVTNAIAAAAQATKAANSAQTSAGDAAEQAKKLAGANANVAELEAQAKDRMITQEDRQKFVNLLANTPKGKVSFLVSVNSGAETERYAEQIREMLIASRFDCSTIGSGFGGTLQKGVFMILRGPTNQPPFAKSMQDAFRAIGIDARGVFGIVGDGDLQILVGVRPTSLNK